MLSEEASSVQFRVQELRETLCARLADKFSEIAVDAEFQNVLEYPVTAGGKRVRPLLALALTFDLGAQLNRTLEAALSLELVHCASLIHDDLPALDNDDLRRGRPACHKAFSEASAILAGDYLVSLALQHLSELSIFSAEERIVLLQSLSEAFLKLTHGQYLDLQLSAEGNNVLFVHRLKTGALFGSSAVFGAVGARAGSEQLPLFQEFGEAFGLFFQVIDDYIDVHGTNVERGREGSSDERNKKVTLFHDAPPEGGFEILNLSAHRVSDRLQTLQGALNVRFHATNMILNLVSSRLQSLQEDQPLLQVPAF